jgi:ferredoxin
MVATDGSSPAHPETAGLATITCLDRTGRYLATLEVPRGTILLRALEKIRFVIGQCGGNGACGSCAVELADGRIVQACFIRVQEDLTVRKIRFR